MSLVSSHSAQITRQQASSDVIQRAESGRHDYVTFAPSLTSIRRSMFRTIQARATACGVDTTMFVENLLDFLTPPNDSRLLRCAKAVIANQMLVSDIDLAETLNLKLVTNDFIAEPDHEYYYVRSWTMNAATLARVVVQMKENTGVDSNKALAWTENKTFMEARVPGQTTATVAECAVRYVGKCRGPMTPWNRFEADIKERQTGVFAEFVQALGAVDPETLANGVVFEFPRGRIGPDVASEIRDEREQAIIALLGKETLLNQQPGGYFISYVPSSPDIHLFQNLGTSFFKDFAARAQAHPDGIVDEWFSSVTSFAIDHPEEILASVHQYRPESLAVQKRQATPLQVGGHTLLVLVGKDITLEEYGAGVPFLGGFSRAGYIVSNFLARLEAQENAVQNYRLLSSKSQCAFPFVDLWPFPGKHKWLPWIRFLSEYLQTVRPLVTVVFSESVTRVAKANFLHEHGKVSDAFLDEVGVISIQHFPPHAFLTDASVTDIPSGYSTVILPLLHPGMDKYADQPRPLREVLDLQTQIVVYVAHQAMQITVTHPNAERDALVQEIWKACRVDGTSMDENYRKLRTRLHMAKGVLRAYWDAKRRPSSVLAARAGCVTEAERARRSEAASETMLRCEKATGLPRSPARSAQTRSLWKLQLPTLMIHLTPTHDDAAKKAEWFKWADDLPNGTFFYASALNLSAPRRDQNVRNAMTEFAPDDATDDSWMDNADLRQAALSAVGERLTTALLAKKPDFFHPDQQRNRRLQAFQDEPIYAHTENLEGREVIIRANGRMVLRWTDPDDHRNLTFLLWVPASVLPLTDENKRTVHFMEHGIALHDENGTPIYRDGYSLQEGVFKASDFFSHSQGRDLEKMWRSHKQLPEPPTTAELATPSHGDIVSTAGAETAISVPPSAHQAPLPPGREPFKAESRAKMRTFYEQGGPIVYNDGIWLMREFLNETYPTGGTFAVADPVIFRKVESCVPSFRTFLEKHPAHPYTRHWQNWLLSDKLPKTTRHINANIRFLRL
ncbi:hypothetical protein HKX48_001389, partial [Thoreauomyces humboldtii]